MTRHPKRPFAVRSAAVLAVAAVVTGVLALPAHADPADASAVAPVAQGVIYKVFARYSVREIFSSKRQEVQDVIDAITTDPSRSV